MKKKWLIGLMALCLLLATVGFVGCGESGSNADNTGGANTEQGDGNGDNNTPTPEKPNEEEKPEEEKPVE
ncbi:MAG: hypothetical protein E7368_04295, partial [Clostridiales bacterium]|nr:hypothetical protein [Clostridiales bacterium]